MTSTSTKFNLKFLRMFSKKDTLESFIALFFPLKDVKPSPDSKMIKLLTFDN